MILDKENNEAEDEGKDDDDENEDALCVLRRCCLELLSALAALTAACLRHRQGGEGEERNSRRSLSNHIELISDGWTLCEGMGTQNSCCVYTYGVLCNMCNVP